jgi:FkbM family methyltransferase
VTLVADQLAGESKLSGAPLWVSVAARLIRALPAGRYRAMNLVGRRSTRAFWGRMPADAGGLLFRCDLRDLIMREVCFTGRYEPQETALLKALLGPGLTFVDVGANWGYFSLFAAHLVGPAGRVVSVEADPRACAVVRVNVAANALGHVTVIGAAASDVPGTLLFTTYGDRSDDSANFGVALTSTHGASSPAFAIDARTLDSVLDDATLDRIDLLKMDIEGAECRAVAGLHRRLAAGKIDRIILELHPEYLEAQGSAAEALMAVLRAHGYQAWHIDHSPETHRRAASGGVADLRTLLTPVEPQAQFTSWPHVLLARAGLDPVPQERRA